MGNKCCGQNKKLKEIFDTSNPALNTIREAQRKYFNSHIESDLDDSDEEREESTDGLYGSDVSLSNLDNDTFEEPERDSTIVAETTSVVKSTITSNDSIDGPVIGNGSVNNNNIDNGDMATTTTTVDVTSTTVEKEETPQGDITKNATASSKTAPVVKRREKAKYIRLSKRGNFFSIFNTEDKKARSVDPKMYQYPFENIVFEGGGNKGLAYCGAVRLLEELNIWPQIKRLAGTSAGAMTASLLAVGYDSHDLEQFFSLNLNKIFLDHKFGYLSLLPNLLTSYGWNPGNKIFKWFGNKFHEKTGDMDITFKEVYDKFGRELCIVVTNLNQMTSLYCHPKTTPDMPVRLAVRMSMSIPGMFKAVRQTVHGQTDIFVDGGVLCNYPIHCFDGWWLSMKPEDNFLEKLQPLEDIPRLLERTERFGTYNENTLGMQLYSDNEQDLLKYQLENLRHGVQLQELPNTRLAREKIKKKKLQLKTDREHRRLVKAMNSFLRALRKHNADRNDIIDREELEAALTDEDLFPRSRRLILFGDVGSDVILDYLDKDHNGQISYNELLSFMEETGISMQNRFLGYQRRNIKNFPTFCETLQATLLTNVKRVYVEERDLKRTVGINTGHVGTSDFILEPADISFVLERGRRSLEAFLKYYVASNHLKKKPEFRRFNDDDARKDSRGFLVQDNSSQNSGNAENPAVPPLVTDPDTLSPPENSQEAETSEPATFSNDELPTPTNKLASRTRSASSAKSVSISERVEFIGSKIRYDSNSGESITEENEEEGDYDEDNSEKMCLLDDTLEDLAKYDSTGAPINSKNHNVEQSAVNGYGSPSSANSPLSSPTNKNVSSKGKATVLLSSLKVDVQVHKSPDTLESPEMPLLMSTEKEELELQPLGAMN